MKNKIYSKIAMDTKRKKKERIIAIHRVDSQRVLYKIATRDDNPDIRYEAVKAIKRDKYLKTIARYDEKMNIRLVAVEKIFDRYTLYKIAMSKKYDFNVRRRAIEVQKSMKYLKLLSEANIYSELVDVAYRKWCEA